MDIATLALAYVGERFPADLTIRQLALLAVVCDEGGHETKALAERLGVSKPVISRATTTLAVMGIVHRANPASDRRRCIVEATDFGRQFRARLALLGQPSIAEAA